MHRTLWSQKLNFLKIPSDKIFNTLILTLLLLLFLYLIVTVVSTVLYVRLDALLSAILSEEILFSIQLSLIAATLATVICLMVAIPVSYALSRFSFPGKDFVDVTLNIPIVTPPVALGATLLIFFTNTPIGAGIENTLLKFVFETPGIVLAQFTVITALAVRVLKSTFDDVDPEFEDIARTLGYNKFQAFFKVTLPLSKNGLMSSMVLAWARAVGEFGATVTLAGATRMKTETLPIAIFLNLATANVEKAVATVIILILIAVIVLFMLQKVAAKGYVL